MSLEWLFSLEIRMYKERKDKDAKRENLGSKNFLKLHTDQVTEAVRNYSNIC